MSKIGSLAANPLPIHEDADGAVRVGGTRVTLETVLAAFHDGSCAEEIVLKYPTLRLEDVYAVITYYLWHRVELDAWLTERSVAEQDLRAKVEARFPRAGVRERLLGRRQEGT